MFVKDMALQSTEVFDVESNPFQAGDIRGEERQSEVVQLLVFD